MILAIFGLFGLLVIGCITVTATQVVREIGRQTGTAAASDYDLSGPRCSVSEFGGATATGRLTNTSNERQGFQVEVRFLAPDRSLIAERSTFTDTLDIGQSTEWTVTTFDDVAGPITCEAEVSYTLFSSGD